MTGGRNKRAGMTLLEVMLAVVMLSTALIAVLTAASRCLAVVGQARNYEIARRLIGQIDVESPLRLLDEIQAGVESGAFKDPRGWSWTRTIADLGEEDENNEGLFLMTLQVGQSGRRGRTVEEVVQYLYVPKDFEGKFTLKPNTP